MKQKMCKPHIKVVNWWKIGKLMFDEEKKVL